MLYVVCRRFLCNRRLRAGGKFMSWKHSLFPLFYNNYILQNSRPTDIPKENLALYNKIGGFSRYRPSKMSEVGYL